MMLSNLIDEVRNRRILAFAALGVLVAVALPLLFLKSAPEGAPAANSAAPAAAKEAKLPARAARLLATTDPGAPGGQANGSAQDPFAPPASYRAAAAAAKNAAGTGSTGATSTATSRGASTTTAPSAVTNSPGSTTANNPTTPRRTAPSINAENASVDIRFGPKPETRIKRAIPRQKAFYIHGKLVAMFVKYSPARKAAVFALAPGLHITGPVKCRVKDGSCRYIDIPAGAHAWISTITPNRTVVRRRLDVVRVERRRPSSSRTRARSASARSEASCLASKLVAMKRGDALLDRDACQRS